MVRLPPLACLRGLLLLFFAGNCSAQLRFAENQSSVKASDSPVTALAVLPLLITALPPYPQCQAHMTGKYLFINETKQMDWQPRTFYNFDKVEMDYGECLRFWLKIDDVNQVDGGRPYIGLADYRERVQPCNLVRLFLSIISFPC